MRLAYLIGGPAVGKSTIAAHMFPGWDWTLHRWGPLWVSTHQTEGRSVVSLGRPDRPFPGTDTLPMNAVVPACAWISTRPAAAVFLEGDRLANDRFLTAAGRAGYKVTVFHVTVPVEELALRRSRRRQDAAWSKGRDTKTARLADRWNAVSLDGTRPADENTTIIHNVMT